MIVPIEFERFDNCVIGHRCNSSHYLIVHHVVPEIQFANFYQRKELDQFLRWHIVEFEVGVEGDVACFEVVGYYLTEWES
jgi:hypothetical protein